MMASSGAGDGRSVSSAAAGIGIQSLAVHYPNTLRCNEHLQKPNPGLVQKVECQQVRWLLPQQDVRPNLDSYEREMAKFAADPFGGGAERHVLVPGETTLDLEISAATEALSAAGLGPGDIDLVLVSSFLPNQIGLGNAALLARELGISAPAWNIESASSGGLVALQNAAALIAAGQYEKILVVVSCSYSRVADEASLLSWIMSDGAGALVVGRVPEGSGFLGFNLVSTAALNDTLSVEPIIKSDNQISFQFKEVAAGAAEADPSIRDAAGPALRDCCEGAARAAGVSITDIDFFVFSTQQAWFPAFCARILGVDGSRTVNTFSFYGNVGPAVMTANLYHAVQSGKIRDRDLVLLLTVGVASTAGAIVMRWGEVALGPPPPTSSELAYQ
jgi:3-oxoacyl-[acyl-carrier-protein] synthase-3